MNDSETPKRKTLGLKPNDGAAPRTGTTRPVRVSDLNRKRVQAVAEGIKKANAGKKAAADKRKAAGPGAGDSRPPRQRGPGAESRPPQRRSHGDDERPPQRRSFSDDQRPPQRRSFGDDQRPPQRRSFGDDQRPSQRPSYGDDRRPPQRRSVGDDQRPPQRRSFGDDQRPPQRRSFGDDQRPPQRRSFGDDQRPPQRRSFGDDQRPPQRRSFGDDQRPPQRRSFGDEQRPAYPRERGGDDRPQAPRPYGDDRRPPARRSEGEVRPARSGYGGTPGRAPKPVERTGRPAPARAAMPQRDEASSADGMVRLSKRMSELGLCSRREADEWIPRGWVLVDGKPVTELGSRVAPDAVIEIHQAARSEQGERVTVLLHKPVGYVSGQAEDGYEPAVALFTPENQWENDPTRKRFAPWQRKSLAPAGRLDIDSTGLLVLTQDGRVARHLIGEDSNVEKEYLVRVVWESPDGPIERNISEVYPVELLDKLRHGLSLDGEALKPAKVSWQNEEQLRFVLREGKKRQIRRMCEQVGLRVVGLKRVRMGRIVLGDLPVGQWRFLGPFEKF
jgi:23S rRNA pseudouridine2604 synthase